VSPRARQDSMRRRLQSGASVRPLDFTVRAVPKLPFGLRLPQSQWGRLLLYAVLIPAAWIACFAVGIGAATLGARLFGCHINEGGDGGCPILGAVSGWHCWPHLAHRCLRLPLLGV
jgi:hypothetical protein